MSSSLSSSYGSAKSSSSVSSSSSSSSSSYSSSSSSSSISGPDPDGDWVILLASSDAGDPSLFDLIISNDLDIILTVTSIDSNLHDVDAAFPSLPVDIGPGDVQLFTVQLDDDVDGDHVFVTANGEIKSKPIS